jgi:hypothetical protein
MLVLDGVTFGFVIGLIRLGIQGLILGMRLMIGWGIGMINCPILRLLEGRISILLSNSGRLLKYNSRSNDLHLIYLII